MSKADEYDVDPVFRSLLMDRLWRVRDQFATVPEVDVANECLRAVRELMQDES